MLIFGFQMSKGVISRPIKDFFHTLILVKMITCLKMSQTGYLRNILIINVIMLYIH